MVNKLLISLWSALLFFVIAAPITFKLTGSLLSRIGIKTQQGKCGCPGGLAVAIHAFIFGIIVLLLMVLSKKKSETYSPYYGYSGLSNPASMARCNGAFLDAQDNGCNVCVGAAETCMKHPYNTTCNSALETCRLSDCSDPRTAEAVVRNCRISVH